MLALSNPEELGRHWSRAVEALHRASQSRDESLVAEAVGHTIHDPTMLQRQIALLRAASERVRVAAFGAVAGQQHDRRWPPETRALISRQVR